MGWFTGAAPGRTGPAVIAGHVDSTDGPAPFDRLRDLAAGATRSFVRSADGTQHTFRVDGVQQYPKDQFPSARRVRAGSWSGPQARHLRRYLRPCVPVHYRDNVVVFAS